MRKKPETGTQRMRRYLEPAAAFFPVLRGRARAAGTFFAPDFALFVFFVPADFTAADVLPVVLPAVRLRPLSPVPAAGLLTALVFRVPESEFPDSTAVSAALDLPAGGEVFPAGSKNSD